MIDDVRGIIERGIHSLHDVLPEIRNLASHPVKLQNSIGNLQEKVYDNCYPRLLEDRADLQVYSGATKI